MSGKSELALIILTGIFMWALYELYREFLVQLTKQPIIATSGTPEKDSEK